ncbi:HTH_Tnp_Tc3_2 domain-containing protein [Trichonephila clavipes]|nr:HTH_Tnp_Tc3_2 domain-containing protein [Trichonephila clavipes]
MDLSGAIVTGQSKKVFARRNDFIWTRNSFQRKRFTDFGSPPFPMRALCIAASYLTSHIICVRDCGLLNRCIAARVGRDPMTASRMWNRWVLDDNTERRTVSQRTTITSSREDRHVTRMVLMDCAATSRTLSQELVSFARQQVSA